MGLDHNIFMNASNQYFADKNNQEQNLLKGADAYYANQAAMAKLNSPDAQAKNLEATAQMAFYKGANGEQLTPQEYNLAGLYVASQSKPAFDPASGRAIVNNPYSSIFDKIANPNAPASGAIPAQSMQGGIPNGGTAPLIPVDRVQTAPDISISGGQEMKPLSMGDVLYGSIGGINIPAPPPPESFGNAQPQGAYRDALFAPTVKQPATPADNPKATQTAIEETAKANVDLQKQAAESPIKVQQAGEMKGAEETAKNEVSARQKIKSADSILSELYALEPKIKNMPGGFVENLVASATDAVNKPNRQALARSSATPNLRKILFDMKQLSRSAGEGTFTDADQELLNGMVIKDDDSDASKTEKYKTLVDMMKRIKDNNTPKNGAKFLGFE